MSAEGAKTDGNKDAKPNFRVMLVQSGPSIEDPVQNARDQADWIGERLRRQPADMVVLPELGTLPFFCVESTPQLFDWAEPIDGPTVSVFAELARTHKVNVVVPLFERTNVRGVFYDSAVFLDRRGQVVSGRLAGTGELVPSYRKVHLSSHFDYAPNINEKYYFRGGRGLPAFDIDGIKFGCLICYDRSFPEAWRVLALAGTQVVLVMAASYATRRAESFVMELRTACMQNGVFCAAANKGGEEQFRGNRMNFFGSSCAIDPFGEVLAHEPRAQGPLAIIAEIDIGRLEESARKYHYMRDRRPDAYGSLLGDGAADLTDAPSKRT